MWFIQLSVFFFFCYNALLHHRNRFSIVSDEEKLTRRRLSISTEEKALYLYARRKWFDFRGWWIFQVSSLVPSSSSYRFLVLGLEISSNSRNFMICVTWLLFNRSLCVFIWKLSEKIWENLECIRIGYWLCFLGKTEILTFFVFFVDPNKLGSWIQKSKWLLDAKNIWWKNIRFIGSFILVFICGGWILYVLYYLKEYFKRPKCWLDSWIRGIEWCGWQENRAL